VEEIAPRDGNPRPNVNDRSHHRSYNNNNNNIIIIIKIDIAYDAFSNLNGGSSTPNLEVSHAPLGSHHRNACQASNAHLSRCIGVVEFRWLEGRSSGFDWEKEMEEVVRMGNFGLDWGGRGLGGG
jgi:uncharacterized protein (DUF2235 family)